MRPPLLALALALLTAASPTAAASGRRAEAPAAALPNCTVKDCPQCFPELARVPENLTLKGPDGNYHEAPFRIGRTTWGWDSMSVYATLVGILAREKIGVEITYTSVGDELSGVLVTNNCIGWYWYLCTLIKDEADIPQGDHMKTYPDLLPDAFFSSQVNLKALATMNAQFDDVLRYSRQKGGTLGPGGFTTTLGLYLMPAVVKRAWDVDALDLRFLGSFRDVRAKAHFTPPRDVRAAGVAADVVGCSNFTESWVQDLVAVLQGLNWTCADSWWLSPACAAHGASWQTECIVMMDASWDYAVPEVYKAVTAMSVPLARLVVGWDQWRALFQNRTQQFNVTFNWWTPDSTLKMNNPVRVVLPMDLQQAPEIPLKQAWLPVLQANNALATLIQRISLENSQMDELMTMMASWYSTTGFLSDGAPVFQKVACDWLRQQESVWKTWLPSANDCLEGTVFDEDLQQCQPCPAGSHFDTARDGSWVCSLCSPGQFAPKAGALSCSNCTAGTFQEDAGASACRPCAPGSSQADLGQSLCEVCDRGRAQASPGSSECTDCVAGTSSQVNATACTSCERGRYAPAGAIGCTPCDEGLTTEGRGSYNVGECVCPEGSFMDLAGGCLQCPVRMTCVQGSSQASLLSMAAGSGPALDFSGAPVPYPQVDPKYWTSVEDPLSVYACLSGQHCPGGGPGVCAAELEGQACAHCTKGFYWDGQACRLCSNPERSAFIFPVLPLLCLLIVIPGQYRLSAGGYAEWNSWKTYLSTLGFIALNHYQVISLVHKSNSPSPGIVAKIFGFWSFTEDLVTLFKIECGGYAGFTTSYSMKLVSPCIVGILTVVCYFASRLLAGLTRVHWLGFKIHRTWGVFFSLIFAFFNGVAALSMALFKCTSNPNGKLTLSQDPSVNCYSSLWNSLVVAAAFAVLVYCIGCGALFLSAILRATRTSNFSNPDFQMRWKFLFIKFRPDVHWWSMAILMRGVLINLAFVVVTSGVGQLYWVMINETMYLSLMIACMPWRHRGSNLLACAASISIIYGCAILAVYSERSEKVDRSLAEMAATFSFFPAGIAVYLAVQGSVYGTGLRQARTKLKYKHLREAVEGVLDMEEEVFMSLFDGTGEWDKFYVTKFCEVIRAEYLGIDTKSRTVSKGTIEDRKTLGAMQSETKGAANIPALALDAKRQQCADVWTNHSAVSTVSV